MKVLFFVLVLTIFSTYTFSLKTAEQKLPNTKVLKQENLVYKSEITLASASGTKSVLFNSNGTKLYAMNLEGLSVSEFNQATKSRTREFKFKATKGMGFDYQTKLATPSYQEKPVEACFSNNDKILWVSLHNAGGIVPIEIDKDAHCPNFYDTNLVKKIVVKTRDNNNYKIDVPLIKTGSTPKVIEVANKHKNLLVSNWHSNTVSVLNINENEFPYGKLIKTIPVVAIPRGIVVDDENDKSYIAIMGSNSLAVINNKTWAIEKYLQVLSNPRHILLADNNELLVSFNSLNKVASIDKNSGKLLYSIPTHAQPRSMVLSENKEFLFVTCYNGNTVDIFKRSNQAFIPYYSLNCPGKPVGIDLFENESTIEAWVCNYVGGNIKVFTFSKM